MRDLVMMAIGATLMALAVMFVLTYAVPGLTVYDTVTVEQADTFNGRWMPMLPPQPEIRTELHTDAPHCIVLKCKVV